MNTMKEENHGFPNCCFWLRAWEGIRTRDLIGKVVENMMRVGSNLCYAEMDPSGRYGRFKDILGKGAVKTVYKAFDVMLGIEVAWSQVMLNDVLRSPDELERLYTEVHLLKNLNHESILRLHNSWIDTERRTFNFITEMLTSGTLREYRQKYKEVDIRAIKNWARQILEGLVHLHSLETPVIHRDLKCDNIFVNGHLGQVKIGDLGLAKILRDSQCAHCVVGTPEFMAPELYEEEYDERVDVYAFGMCVLEMLTSEYPYSECSNSAQIYKKVTTGKKPEAFYRIQDEQARQFVATCLEDASTRPSAHELLFHPFLAIHEERMLVHEIPVGVYSPNGMIEETCSLIGDCDKSTEMTITGTVNPDDNTLFLKVRISDKDGHVRNIDFPFDAVNDTAMEVATEMVKDLDDITDLNQHEIAQMIEDEISSLIPGWKDLDSPQKSQLQHSFDFNDDDDENNPPYLSSYSPSHDSFHGLSISFEESSPRDLNPLHNFHNLDQEHLLNNEDAISESSYSYSVESYSDVEYSTQQNDVKTEEYSRFCPLANTNYNCNPRRSVFSMKGLGNKKLSKFRDFMDIRSQLLHRAVVQAVNKRRSAKTVGSVESFGFRDPT